MVSVHNLFVSTVLEIPVCLFSFSLFINVYWTIIAQAEVVPLVFLCLFLIIDHFKPVLPYLFILNHWLIVDCPDVEGVVRDIKGRNTGNSIHEESHFVGIPEDCDWWETLDEQRVKGGIFGVLGHA